jgi:hypothetical protein
MKPGQLGVSIQAARVIECRDNPKTAAGGIVQIKLQSSVGAFDETFMQRLPLLEQAMIAHGLDPSMFVIAKDASLFTNARAFGTTFRDYTVFVGDKHFTVTQPSDIRFLEYFYERCIAPDEAAPTPHHKLESVLGKLVHWMEQPV